VLSYVRGVDDSAGLRVTVAEYAAANRDGTYTIIRGGIAHVEATPEIQTADSFAPSEVTLCVFVEISPGVIEKGAYDVSGCLLAQGMAAVTPSFVGRLEIISTTVPTRFAVTFGAIVMRPGVHTLQVFVGDPPSGLYSGVPLDVRAPAPTIKT
jgi:hypothetical protein